MDKTILNLPARAALSTAAMIALTGCASLGASGGEATSQQDRLYFGRAIGDTALVSDSAWTVFLRDVVTPRFPNGFTVVRAEGQWLGASNSVIREPTFVLEIVHDRARTVEASLSEIISEYKRRFNQEAVMRLTSPVRARF